MSRFLTVLAPFDSQVESSYNLSVSQSRSARLAGYKDNPSFVFGF